MIQGVIVPVGMDVRTLVVLERYSESLIEVLAEEMWEEGDRSPISERCELAERLLAEALTRFLRYGDAV